MKKNLKWQIFIFVFLASSAGNHLLAQKTLTPYTPTLPGIDNPIFPYENPEKVGISSKNLEKLSKEIRSWVAEDYIVGGELLIIKSDKIIFHESYGWADREADRPLTRNAIYNGASMAKPYTNTAILMLVDQDKMQLNDPVSKYLKDFPDDETLISDLLTHTSGYGYKDPKDIIYPIPDTIKTRNQWVDMLIKMPKVFELGEFNYTNFNQYFLARIIEIVSGVTTEEYIQANILNPIGARDTYLYFYPKSDWKQRIPTIYSWSSNTREFERLWDNTMNGWTSFFTGASDIFLTTMDFARLLALWSNKGEFNNHRLFSKATANKALKDQVISPSEAYGYAWFLNQDKKELVNFGHGGLWGTTGYAIPNSKFYVLFFTQSYLPDLERRALRVALWNRLHLWEISNEPLSNFFPTDGDDVQELDLYLSDQQKYLGNYHGGLPNGDTLNIEVATDEDRLILKDKPVEGLSFNWKHLAYIGDHSFIPGYYRNGQLAYTTLENGEIKFTMENEYAIALEIWNDGRMIFRGVKINKSNH